MARHYTDAIAEEDRRAATHVAGVLRGEVEEAAATESSSTAPAASA